MMVSSSKTKTHEKSSKKRKSREYFDSDSVSSKSAESQEEPLKKKKKKSKEHKSHKEHKERKYKKSEKQPSSLVDEDKQSPSTFSNSDPLSVAQALSLEYAITQLQQSVSRIITEAPNLDQLNNFVTQISKLTNTYDIKPNNGNDQNDTSSMIIVLARNQKLQLAAKLKSLYEAHQLKLFDQIASFDENTELEGIEKVSLTLKKTSEQNSEESEDQNDSCTEYPPPLPKIISPSIESQVFVHKSVINNVKHLSKSDILHSHNERLEFLGDSIVNTAITEILYSHYPDSTEGNLSILRSQLVSNSVLSEFSHYYDLDKKLQFNFNNDTNFMNGKQKIFSDVFEAYVGGLYVDSNYTNFTKIKNWLEKLITPRLKALETATPKANVDYTKDAKGELYALIGSAARPPKYLTVEFGDGLYKPFKVHCLMDDEVIGKGEASNSKIAGIKAAMDALSNRSLIAKYSMIRMNTPRDVSVKSAKAVGTVGTPPSNKEGEEKQDNKQASSLDKTSPKKNALPVDAVGIFTPDEKITISDLISLPIEVPEHKYSKVDQLAKGKVHSFLSKRKVLPVYKIESLESNRFKATMLINDVKICSSVDSNKRIAQQKCAMFLLDHPSLLPRCYVF